MTDEAFECTMAMFFRQCICVLQKQLGFILIPQEREAFNTELRRLCQDIDLTLPDEDVRTLILRQWSKLLEQGMDGYLHLRRIYTYQVGTTKVTMSAPLTRVDDDPSVDGIFREACEAFDAVFAAHGFKFPELWDSPMEPPYYGIEDWMGRKDGPL